MKILHYLKKGFPIQYNNLIAVTPVPGLKFTNWYGEKFSFFFWHVVLAFGFLVALAVNLKFWYQYQLEGLLLVFSDLELGLELAFPAVYVCLRHALDPNKLAKYRKNFLLPNSTISMEAIDSGLQHMFRVQHAALNVSNMHFDSIKNNVDMIWLDQNIDKLFYHVDDQLKDCSFQGLHRKCSEIFKSDETVFGQCFVFNSIFTDKNIHEDPHRIQYAKISESDDDWSLRFNIMPVVSDTFATVYLKHPKTLLSFKDFPRYVWYPMKQTSDFAFSVIFHVCEDTLRKLAVRHRRCIFPDEAFSEPNLKAEFNTSFYDNGVCLNHCHAWKFVELCSCWPNFAKNTFPKMANKTRSCGINDMDCYEKNYVAVRQTRCIGCWANCNGAFYHLDLNAPDLQETEIYNPNLNASLDMNYFEIDVNLIFWPLVHLFYFNSFYTTEFILALASTACLFLGISILTFMEAFYNFFIRFPLFYFINWEYFVKTMRKREEIESQKPLPCINMRLKSGLHKH